MTLAPQAEELTPAQFQRRLRILEEALMLADGGYDAVGMRAVAAQADVAIGTLYRYFPSKEHLLVCAFGLWLQRFEHDLGHHVDEFADPFSRLWIALVRLTDSVTTRPLMSSAITRAYLFADAGVALEVDHVRSQLVGIFAGAMSSSKPSDSDLGVGELMADVLASNLLALANGRKTVEEVRDGLAATLTVLATRPWIRA